MNNFLPPNQTPLESAMTNAVMKPIIPNNLGDLWSPDFCPPNFLPWLAWSLSVDAWHPDWSISVKRAQIKKSGEIHFQKGTVAAVENVVKAFGGALLLKEWWQTNPRGEPGTFSINLSLPTGSAAPNSEYLNSIFAAIDAVKPLSAHYSFILATGGFANLGLVKIIRAVHFGRAQALIKPSGGGNITYLTDQEGHFLTDEEGNLLIENFA